MFIRLPIRLIFLSNSRRHPQDKKSTVIIFKFAVIRLKKIHENGDQKFTVKYLKIEGAGIQANEPGQRARPQIVQH